MRRAVATACVRVETPSLAIAAPSWVRAVSGEMKSSRPIVSFEWPSARRRRTSRSLAVRPSSRAGRGADEDVGERGIDVHPAGGDGLERADERVERRVLEHEAAGAGVQRLGEQGAVAEAGVDDAVRTVASCG